MIIRRTSPAAGSTRIVLARPSRADRRRDRRAVGSLRDNVVTPITAARYAAAFVSFMGFADRYFGGEAETLEALDRGASAYLEELWGEGEARAEPLRDIAPHGSEHAEEVGH